MVHSQGIGICGARAVHVRLAAVTEVLAGERNGARPTRRVTTCRRARATRGVVGPAIGTALATTEVDRKRRVRWSASDGRGARPLARVGVPREHLDTDAE